MVMVLDSMHIHNSHGQTLAGGKNVIIFGADMSSSVHVNNIS